MSNPLIRAIEAMPQYSGMSKLARSYLIRVGFKTFDEFLDATRDDILRVDNVGRKTANEIARLQDIVRENYTPPPPGCAPPMIDGFLPEGQLVAIRDMTLRDYAAIHGPGMHEDATIDYARAFNRDSFPAVDDMVARVRWWAKADWAFRYMQADVMLAARGTPVMIKAIK
jgi:hypothetical protein